MAYFLFAEPCAAVKAKSHVAPPPRAKKTKIPYLQYGLIIEKSIYIQKKM